MKNLSMIMIVGKDIQIERKINVYHQHKVKLF